MTVGTVAVIAVTTGLLLTASCTQATPDPSSDADMAEVAHPEEAAVVAAVEQLFEAMRTGDSDMAAAVFHPEARLGRAGGGRHQLQVRQRVHRGNRQPARRGVG